MEFSFPHALANDVVGYPRTGPTKPFLFLQNEVMYKGPYKHAEKRFTNLIARSLIFEAWKTPCVVKAAGYVETPDGIFIRLPNLFSGSMESESHREEFSDLTYQVLKNPSIVEIPAVLTQNRWIFSQVENLLVALCHCYILSIGNLNLGNCLVDLATQTFHVLDVEDIRTADGEGPLFYFNKAPAKKFGWAERVSGHYPAVANRLLSLREDPIIIAQGLLPRLNATLHLLQQHARAAPTPVTPPIIIEKPSTLTLVETVSRPPISMGQMVWKGLRGGVTKTYSGHDFDVAKSALQKYIRRQMTQKAILTGIEIFRLGEIGGEAAVTNLFNRIVIIANEDIGPANYPLVLEVTRLIESGIRDVHTLVAIIQLLAESPKTRLMSQAWFAYATRDGRAIATKMHLPIDSSFNETDQKYLATSSNSDLFLPTDPETIRPYISIFLKRLRDKDYNAYSWAYFFLEASKNLTLAKRRKFIEKSPRSMTGKVDILLWKALGKVLAPEIHDILVEAYFNHTENGPFLQNAIAMALSGLTRYTPYDIHPTVEAWKQTPTVQDMLQGTYSLVITKEESIFIVDVHTAAGKKLGRTKKDFLEVGAVVIPQDSRFYNPTLAAISKSS